HRTRLPVGEAGSEQVDDLVPVHVAVCATHQRRRDELAERRYEHEEEGCDDAGQREWQRHPTEGLQTAGPQIARGLEQTSAQALERDEDRESHEREPDVTEHEHDRESAVEKL